MIVLLYLQGFTAIYTIKEMSNIFLSSDKKNDWGKSPNPDSSHIMYMYIGFAYVMPSPRKYF